MAPNRGDCPSGHRGDTRAHNTTKETLKVGCWNIYAWNQKKIKEISAMGLDICGIQETHFFFFFLTKHKTQSQNSSSKRRLRSHGGGEWGNGRRRKRERR